MLLAIPQRPCLYCGVPTKRGKKGEHIVPNAIGGALTLNEVSGRVVCRSCNSGVLSQLDRELCSRSYLSAVASQKIAAHLWQAWDVDHAADNLLVEARPSWAADGALNGLVCYPQITFERTGPVIRTDLEEATRFGKAELGKVLWHAVRRCFGRYCAGQKRALHFERVESSVIHEGYRLAPRVFTRHSIFEIARNINAQSFVVRFVTDEDKRRALHGLDSLDERRQFTHWHQKPGSYAPTLSFFFDIGDTLRALMKVGLNLVAAFCPRTPVNRDTFAHPIRAIRGGVQIPPRLLDANGFVHAEDIQEINGAANEHSFRLVHFDGVWHVYQSFFGGAIGALVRFPGPNHEDWRSADIVAPIRSKEWRITTGRVLRVLKARIVWNDSRVVTPSVKLQDTVSSVRVEITRRR